MKYYPPSDNPITGEYTDSHRAYDRAGLNLPDEIRVGDDGIVIDAVNLYTTNWINNGKLTTKDYGNYIIVKHTDGTRELHAHLKKGSMLPVNTKVVRGQVIARIGNTGNSTGPHLHSEYRDSQNKNIPVEFSKELSIANNTMPIQISQEQLDYYKRQEQEIKDLKKIETGLRDVIRLEKDPAILRLTEANSKLTAELAECNLKCQQGTDSKYNNLIQSIAEICIKIFKLEFIADVRKEIKKRDG